MEMREALKSLERTKWCTQFHWCANYEFDASLISALTSLRHLNIENHEDDDNTKLPLESFPKLTSLAINMFSLALLAKIQNPLLLHHLAINEIEDWHKDGNFAELLRFKSLHTLRLSGDTKRYPINRLRMSALMSSLTQLQRLSIYSISLTPVELTQHGLVLFRCH
jgi:hypothetical protein